jgi:hypothetical protein
MGDDMCCLLVLDSVTSSPHCSAHASPSRVCTFRKVRTIRVTRVCLEGLSLMI